MFLKKKVRYIRKFKCSFPGLTKKKINQRKNKPGEHPFFSSKKTSVKKSFLDRLHDKQKLKLTFCLSERQLKNYIKYTLFYLKDNPFLGLYNILHSRLDYIIYNLHLAKTILQARQLINHGQIWVNSKKEKHPSFSCKVGDLILTKSNVAKGNIIDFLVGRVFFNATIIENSKNLIIKLNKPEFINLEILKLIQSVFEFYL
jgi:small subunit ribosomal protein S4